jgi:hypothetical protein
MQDKPTKSRKLKSEKETREGLLCHAKRLHCEQDLQQLFDKWDRLIALAPPSEKQDMSRIAILEIQAFLDIRAQDGLTINGETVLPFQFPTKN